MRELRDKVAVVTGGASGIGRAMIAAVREERFYILPHPDLTHARVRARTDDILQGRTPSPAPLSTLR